MNIDELQTSTQLSNVLCSIFILWNYAIIEQMVSEQNPLDLNVFILVLCLDLVS